MTRLLTMNVALAALMAAHIADHALRQHDGELTGAAAVPGLLGAVAVFASLALTLRRHPRARVFAAVVGISTAIGFVAVHLLPKWGALSDPYADRHLDALSWAGMIATLVAAALLAAVALAASRPWERGERRSA
jgi:hypothetical protein